MPDFPVTIADDYGDRIEISVGGGRVRIDLLDGVCVSLDAEHQEAFGQAYIAACNAADRQRAASHVS